MTPVTSGAHSDQDKKAFKETQKIAQMAGAQAAETKRLLAASASANQEPLQASDNLFEATNKGSKGKRPAEDEAGENTPVD